MKVEIIEGDCIDKMREMASESVHACVTDPPYELTAKKRGGSGIASLNLKSPAGRSRITTGFMGKAWDGTGIAFSVEMWAEVFRILKPGSHVVAFGGTRTYHRMVCAIEDAGFEIRDQLAWVFGSGFPKSHNLENDWEGWGTALKPAWEPIVLARKPFTCTVAENVDLHGSGAINIQGCRIELNGDYKCAPNGRPSQTGLFDNYDPAKANKQTDIGRWPANLCHDGSEEVIAGFPVTTSGARSGNRTAPKFSSTYSAFKGTSEAETPSEASSGSASRFFYCAKTSVQDREAGLREAAFARSGGAQNAQKSGDNYDAAQSIGFNRVDQRLNVHPTVKPTELMRWLCRMVTPPNGTIIDPFLGSGSTGRGAVIEGFDFIGIEKDPSYVPIARARIIEAQGPLFSDAVATG